jgi:allantoicase
MSHLALGQHYVHGFTQDQHVPPVLELLQGKPEKGYQPIEVLHPPGTHFQYSGGGFLVLEHLVELITGKTAATAGDAFLQKNGLKHSTFQPIPDRAIPFAEGRMDDGAMVPQGQLAFPSFAAGASGTAADLLKFLTHITRAYRDLQGSSAISHDTAVRMLASRDLGCREFMGCDIGLGIFVIEAAESRWMLHQGANEGFRALFLHCFDGPDAGKGLAVLVNADNSGVAAISDITQEVLKDLRVSGVDFSRFHSDFDDQAIPQEQKVNRGYRDRIFAAFQPQLPEAIHQRGPLDSLHEWNQAVGAKILRVSNQRFARAENLFNPHEPTFDPLLYCRQGKVMDSWESARHNEQGFDFIEFETKRLISPQALSLNTWYHDGNHAEFARVLAWSSEDQGWIELFPKTRLAGHSVLHVRLESATGSRLKRYQRFRIEMFPDGGLSRLGLFEELPERFASQFLPSTEAKPIRKGEPIPQPKKPLTLPVNPIHHRNKAKEIDWACLSNGGRVVRASNQHYGPASQVISPIPPLHMFDGFESARSRTLGHHEELELELGCNLQSGRIQFDYTHFVNNNPRAVRVLGWIQNQWQEISKTASTKEFAGNQQLLPIEAPEPINKILIEIFPDGGINRIHVFASERGISKDTPNQGE